MKIFGRYFAFPIYVRFAEPGIFYSDKSRHFLTISVNSFYFHVCPIDRMGGTMDTTSLIFQLGTSTWSRQLTLCWRPDVTHYYWNKESYFAKKRELFKKQYGYYPGEKPVKFERVLPYPHQPCEINPQLHDWQTFDAYYEQCKNCGNFR